MVLHSFEATVQRLISEAPQGRILLAVSGGIDSMTMANLFLRSRWRGQLGVAHVNFCLRGAEADGDEALVRQWAEQADLPFFSMRFDTLAYAKQRAISTQMAARELRYRWFADLMDQEGYRWLAIAHNQDDGVETLFLNLLRGTGYRGLGGIRSQNGVVIRPLLGFSRQALLSYAQQVQLSYREDRTNSESHYARNRLRNVVFPELEKINPSFKQTVSRNIRYFTQAQEILDQQLGQLRASVLEEGSDCITIWTGRLFASDHQEFWTYGLLADYGFNAAQVQDLLANRTKLGRVFQSDRYELVTAEGLWRIYPRTSARQEGVEIYLHTPTEFEFMGRRYRFQLYDVAPANLREGAPDRLYFDAGKSGLPLRCRSWRAADRFCPYGMRGASKKLSDFFVDQKIDRHQKQLQPVITAMHQPEDCLGEEVVVLLPGLRLDERFRITESTRLFGEISCL